MIAEIDEARNQYMMQNGNYPSEVWLGHLEYSALRLEMDVRTCYTDLRLKDNQDMIVFDLTVRRSAEKNCLRIGATMDFTGSLNSLIV